jgi:hypothetical protein
MIEVTGSDFTESAVRHRGSRRAADQMPPRPLLGNQVAQYGSAATAQAAQRSTGRIFVIVRWFRKLMFIWNLRRG